MMRDVILEELQFSTAIVLSREEVVPRFRIMVPGAPDYIVFVPLPDDLAQRQWRMQLVSAFMAWKGATGFVKSSELMTPDAVVAVGVNRTGGAAALRPLLRKPLSAGQITWLSRDQIGDEIPALLPPVGAAIDAGMIADLERVFGSQGEFKVERAQH
jgi:hypothetical protein